MPRKTALVVLVVVPVVAFGIGRKTPAVAAPPGVEPALPPATSLPRPKLVWAVDGASLLRTQRGTAGGPVVVLLGDGAVAVLDPLTGRQTWKAPVDCDWLCEVDLNGGLLIVRRPRRPGEPGELLALDAATLAERWRVDLPCDLRGDLHQAGDRGFGVCWPRREDAPKTPAMSLDLRIGGDLRRFPTIAENGGAVTDGKRAVVLGEGYLLSVDAVTGKRLWKSPVKARGEPHFESLGDVILLADDGINDVYSGSSVPVRIIALRSATGQMAWRAESRARRDPDIPLLPRHLNLVVTADGDDLVGRNPRTGLMERRWPLPQIGEAGLNDLHIQANDRWITATVAPRIGGRHQSYLVTWNGQDRKILQNPPNASRYARLVGDLWIVPELGNDDGGRLEAFSLRETAAPEQTLDAAARVAAVLGRHGSASPEAMDELQEIPGSGAILRALVRNPRARHREQAIELVAAMRDPEAVPLLLSVLEEPSPPPPGRKPKLAAGGTLLERTQLNLTALGADPRDDAVPFGVHRAVSFDAWGKRLLYIRAAAGKATVVVRELATGREAQIDPGPGLLWRASLDPDGSWVVLDVVARDTDGNGKLDWPVAATSLSGRHCRGPVASYYSGGHTGDESVKRVAPVSGGAVRDVPDLIRPFGSALLRRTAKGALVLERAGATRELVPASCGGTVLHADPGRGLVAVRCNSLGGHVWLHGERSHERLGFVVEAEDHDGWSHPQRLVEMGQVLVDLETRALRPNREGEWTIHTWESRSLFGRRNGRLSLVDTTAPSRPPIELPGQGDGLLTRLDNFVALHGNPHVIVDLRGGVVTGTSALEPLAIASDGRVLVGSKSVKAGRLVQLPVGPLRWVRPSPLPGR